MIEATLFTLLTANAGVTALVGTRVYPVQLPQAPTTPAVSYQLISEHREGSFAGPSGLPGTLIQVDSWSDTYLGVKTLATAVRLALDGYQGTPAGGDRIQASILENQSDIFEPDVKLFRVLQEFRLWWDEPQA
jgi:hypothetical protein